MQTVSSTLLSVLRTGINSDASALDVSPYFTLHDQTNRVLCDAILSCLFNIGRAFGAPLFAVSALRIPHPTPRSDVAPTPLRVSLTKQAANALAERFIVSQFKGVRLCKV